MFLTNDYHLDVHIILFYRTGNKNHSTQDHHRVSFNEWLTAWLEMAYKDIPSFIQTKFVH